MALEDGETERLDGLSAWMRRNGVRHARVSKDEVEVEFEGTPSPLRQEREEPKARTPEDIARERREQRRAQYRLELGHDITDEMLDRLP